MDYTSSDSAALRVTGGSLTPQQAVARACDLSPPDWHAIIALVQTHGSAVIDARTAQFRRTLLHVAAARGRLDYAHLLVARGADVAARDLLHWTPLLEAAANGQEALIAPLVAYGADVDAGNVQKNTSLHYASSYGHVGTVRELLNAGGTVDARNPAGRVPLHFAADVGSFEVARALLQSGAQTSVRDVDGETPADAAEKNGHAELARFLRRYPNIDEDDNRSEKADVDANNTDNADGQEEESTEFSEGQSTIPDDLAQADLLGNGFGLTDTTGIEEMWG